MTDRAEYTGSIAAPDLAPPDEPREPFDVEGHQALNLRDGIGELFYMLVRDEKLRKVIAQVRGYAETPNVTLDRENVVRFCDYLLRILEEKCTDDLRK